MPHSLYMQMLSYTTINTPPPLSQTGLIGLSKSAAQPNLGCRWHPWFAGREGQIPSPDVAFDNTSHVRSQATTVRRQEGGLGGMD